DFHCPSKEETGWKVLQDKIVSGQDLNPHLSKLHRSLFNADGLLAEWGVDHFHLGTEPDPNNPRYVKRDGPLVFALVNDSAFYAINTYQHGDWEKLGIVESLHRNWPDAISKYRLRGIAPEKLSEKARRTLRNKRCNTAVGTADGTVYGSIGGLTSGAGIKSESVRDADIW